MSEMPCKNPNCHSYGQPHPNCQCYGGMAKGGDVTHFCSEARMHEKGCKYYADGGTVSPQVDPSLFEMPQTKPEDPNHEVAGFLINHGAAGLLNPSLMNDPMKYQASAQSGHKKLKSYVGSLFSGEKLPVHDHSKSKKSLEDWMEKGGVTHDIQQALYQQHQDPVQMFAKGGAVAHNPLKDDEISSVHPAQNILLAAARGKISEYLNKQKPQKNTPKLAFDPEPDNTAQKKTYEKVKDLAAHPLSLLHHVQKGTLDQEHVTHFSEMFPNLADAIQKEITEHVTKNQLEGKKPPYKVRQGLSMVLGTALSSEFKQPNIQAAQSTFVGSSSSPSAQGNQPTKSKSTGRSGSKKTALSKSDQPYLTPGQASAERQQKQ